MIVSATFLVQPTFTKLRRFLLREYQLLVLGPLGPGVFAGATVDTAVIIARKSRDERRSSLVVVAPVKPTALSETRGYSIQQTRFESNDKSAFDYRLTDQAAAMLDRLTSKFPAINSMYEFGVGINTGYIRDDLVSDTKKNRHYHPMIPGTGISRYGVPKTKGWIMYDPHYIRSRGKEARTLPAEHLLSSEKILVVRTRNLSLRRRIVATIDRDGGYNLNRLSNIVPRGAQSLSGLLGILNSRLFNWIFLTRFFDYEIKPVYLKTTPLADADNPALVSLANHMLHLHKQIASPKSPSDKTALQRQIDTTDHQIDQLVYKLYGLTEDEIRIVEEATDRAM